VIKHLNGGDEDMFGEFEELSFYHERYLALTKFLVNMKKEKGMIDVKECEKVVEMFEHEFEPDKDSKQPNESRPALPTGSSLEMTSQN
jgi:hypothetical protein